MKRADDALKTIAENIAFIRSELSDLDMPDSVRAEILAACAGFDPLIEKKVLPDDLPGAIEAMHVVVGRLRKATLRDSGLGVVEILVTESAANILRACQAFALR